ncbi:unnamed protein product, partial [marine sediment metagenome]
TAILNFKEIDNELVNIVVPFWKLIWEKENPAIDQKTSALSQKSFPGYWQFKIPRGFYGVGC